MEEELKKQIFSKEVPELYSTDNDEDPMCQVRLVGTALPWEWYVIDGDKESGEFFGYVIGAFPEAGGFWMDDLVSAGCVVDEDYVPERLSVLSERAQKQVFG